MTLLQYRQASATAAEVASHLKALDDSFAPSLSSRVVIADYAAKLASKALLCEAWADEGLVGLVAGYISTDKAFISSVSVLKNWARQGIAETLVGQFVEKARLTGARVVTLEVTRGHIAAIRLYEKAGFVSEISDEQKITMKMTLD